MRRAAATVLVTAALSAGFAGPGAAVALAVVGAPQQVQYPGTVQPGGGVLPGEQPGGGVLPGEQPAGGVLPSGQAGRDSATATTTRARVADVRATLPFTGGELVALVTAGAGAVGAGAALVVATRRRSPQSA